MNSELLVALVVGLSGAGTAIWGLTVNRQGRKAATTLSVTSAMAELADQLREELERERKRRERLHRKVVRLEKQLIAAGLVPETYSNYHEEDQEEKEDVKYRKEDF